MRRLAWVLFLVSAVPFVLVAWPAVRADPSIREVSVAKTTAEATALALARKCLEDHRYRSVGGSPLVPEKATATPRDFGRWLVHVPETRRKTRPTGRDLVVDVVLKTCRRAPMD